ncbi:MAG: peptidoglycan editing factor PgeF [Desulfobacterales bacterium]|jgi:YfiH family protein
MLFTAQNNPPYYRFENLAVFRGIDHRIFTRRSGFSPPPFDSLNISLGIGDAETNVARNRGLIRRSITGGEFVYVRQVHGCTVAVLKDDIQEQGGRPCAAAITADALVTDLSGRYLVIQVADCQAVLLYDPVRQVIANVHCGWRGSILNVIGRTLEAMMYHFNCRPECIRAGIGPALGPCCAEFINYKAEIPAEFWVYKDSRDHFDFWAVSRDQLLRAGVAENNIEVSGICTRCRTDEFYSYRAAKRTGRFAAVIGLK